MKSIFAQKKARKPGGGFRARFNRCEVGIVVRSGDEGTIGSDQGVLGGNSLSNHAFGCEISNTEKRGAQYAGQNQAYA